MTLENTIENTVSVGAGVLLGMTKTVNFLPNASDSLNTFLLAMLGGIGGYVGKEIVRVSIFKYKSKRKDKDNHE